ncbi:hypothetical protein Tco_1362057 [Tanacetum coccineum]
METVHVKFDELTAMASECNNSGPGLYCLSFQDSSEDSNEISSKEDLDNLFGPLYEEYYETKTLEVLNNFTAGKLSIIKTLIYHLQSSLKAPQLVSSSEKSIANEPTTPVSDNNVDESIQEDVVELDRNT